MNIRIALLALLTLSTLNANTCTAKQMGEMIKKGISSEDIDKICEINETEVKKKEVKKKEVKKKEVKKKEVKKVKKDEIINDNHLLKGELLFIQYESGKFMKNGNKLEFKGFSIGSTKKYKNHLFSSIYKPLSIEIKNRYRGVTSKEMNTFKFKYGYGYKASTKNNIIIQPELVFTNMDIEDYEEVHSLMAVLRANIEYTKGNSLNFSYVLAGLRSIKTIDSVFSTYAEDTVPGMLSIEAKHKLFNKLTINGLYKRYKNDTIIETNLGVGAKYQISKIYIQVMFEAIFYNSSKASVNTINPDRVTFRVGYNF